MKVSAALVRRRRRLRCAVTVATAAAQVVGASGVATAAVSGVDVASYQHPNDASINWDAVHNSGGQTFAMVKATEGNTGDYVNPYFQADARAVKSAGMYLST